MADTLKGAGESLRRCEMELRDLGAQALRDGDYHIARRVTELAEALADRRTRAGLADEDQPSPVASTEATIPATKPVEITARKSPSKELARSRARTGAHYPRFIRRGEKLIKIGWSKKNREEYEHATTWPAVLAFAEHLRSRTRPGRIFTIEGLMPVPDPENNSELPGYQVYLALAWFRAVGLVEKRGREGYIADRDGLTDDGLVQRWAALSSQDT